MCKSISIFIIQCPPKIMYICIYIYIYTHEYLPTRTAGFSFLERLDFWILVLGA